MNNKHKVIGTYHMGQIDIDIIDVEPCYRISQYMKGEPITCQCTGCKKRGQSPSEAKAHMDKVYKT